MTLPIACRRKPSPSKDGRCHQGQNSSHRGRHHLLLFSRTWESASMPPPPPPSDGKRVRRTDRAKLQTLIRPVHSYILQTNDQHKAQSHASPLAQRSQSCGSVFCEATQAHCRPFTGIQTPYQLVNMPALLGSSGAVATAAAQRSSMAGAAAAPPRPGVVHAAAAPAATRRALLSTLFTAAGAVVAVGAAPQAALAFGNGFPGYDINLDGRKRAMERNKRELQREREKGDDCAVRLLQLYAAKQS